MGHYFWNRACNRSICSTLYLRYVSWSLHWLSSIVWKDSNGIDSSTLEDLQSLLNSINPCTQTFSNARRRILQSSVQNFGVRILQSRGRRQYNRPIASEIAGLIDVYATTISSSHGIVVYKTNRYLQRNANTSFYMSLLYTLHFPFGIDLWRRGLLLSWSVVTSQG